MASSREERKWEIHRLMSFRNWKGIQTPELLAKAGFYFFNVDDRVMCFECGLGLKDWQPTDVPDVEHRKWKPNYISVDPNRLGIIDKAPRARFVPRDIQASYKNWPVQMRQRPEELTKKGFYYSDVGDEIHCVHCDFIVRQMEADECPLVIHKRAGGCIQSMQNRHPIEEGSNIDF
ncbi:hypothetical protein B566_EDAN017892 [Ephemera danica]|nr:hypothetical protein B566_EDAN017892 [Ephemera danica]